MSENIGSVKPTQIPAYEDDADIKAALRLYHYGQTSVPANSGEVPAESIAGYLLQIESDIADLTASSGIQASIVDVKGDMIVAKSNNVVDNFSVGNNNEVLVADSTTTFGMTWSPVTNLVSAASTSAAGKVQLEDSITSTSISKAATPNSVKTVHDTVDGVMSDLEVLSQTVNPSVKTSDYTLQASDAGKVIISNVTTGTNVITIPLNSIAGFTANTRIDILQIGSVQTIISPVVGVTINSKYNNKKLAVQYSAATLIKIADDSWVLIGDLTA
jgi:hypothetical protein